ncbi:MAG: hypothetical protein WAO35_19650 [Terriglobia bacterium]
MAHRYKLYAAETGTAYQYFFARRQAVKRPEGQGAGNDYIFIVTPDQRSPFILRVFVSERALGAWRQAHGRDLDSNEIYAAAKMRLFRAFDELSCLRDAGLSLLVDEGNIEELLMLLEL